MAINLKEYTLVHYFLEKSPDKNPDWYNKKGSAYISQEEWAKAVPVYKEALKTHKKASTEFRENW